MYISYISINFSSTLKKKNYVSSYNYDWKMEEAEKNILRTHTTAVSARMLYKLAQEVMTPAFVIFNNHNR